MARGRPAPLPPDPADKPVWEQTGRDWPNRDASRFVQAAGFRWHVQVMGTGPVILLLHGAGAATHSWRALAPLLAKHFTVVAPDLPGHGFTDTPGAKHLSLPGVANGLAALLQALDLRPALAVGHSAGAAVAARMVLDGLIQPRALIALNGALLGFRGAPAYLFAPLARMAVGAALVPKLLAWRAGDRALVRQLIAATGSTIDESGVDLYARVARRGGHVAGTMAMMANWDLRPLERDLPRLALPVTLVVGAHDRTIPPAAADQARALIPNSAVLRQPGLGHLAHEERPAETAALIERVARGRWRARVMQALFASGHVADLLIALVLAEACALIALRRRTRIAVGAVLFNLGAGVCLLLALRCALTGTAWIWIAFWLASSGLAHAGDLRARISSQTSSRA